MNLPQRLRNIYLTQVKAIKERLDRIDAEAEWDTSQRRYERDARAELDDVTEVRPPLRTPEEIASGASRPAPITPHPPITGSPLAIHYRVLGLDDGADFTAVQAAYGSLMARCAPERFPEGSEEQKTVLEIRKRVEAAYDALRDALDPTAGRFDKLEF